ncbi:MAG TPA: DedA family protein [Phycisphaerae bacterium]|nr:DedA family protein [Phycisphaerae bacterium]
MAVEHLRDLALWTIDHFGYSGAAGLMALESMILPVPSELVMPPVGMLVHQGRFALGPAMAITSLGSLVGSLISYYAGYFGGKPLVLKAGRWVFLNQHHLELTERWFHRWGGGTVFLSRFIPVVRHFISIPAGTARMNIVKFMLYTVVGATLWNSFLLWIGWKLESQWETVLKYRTPIDVSVAASLVVVVVAWFWLHMRRPRPEATGGSAADSPISH